MNKKFAPQDFFDLSSVFFTKLFNGIDNVWEILDGIDGFIKNEFSSGAISGNYQKHPDVFIGKNTTVAPGALIQGPAIIGDNCVVGHGSLIRGGCILGDNVHIGHGAEVKHSVFLSGSTAAHLNYVGDSIIGNRVNISGGVILANFRFDKQKVFIRLENSKIQTNLSKFGAVVGDDCFLGVNSVLNPGTILGKLTVVYPLVSVTGVHQEKERIKPNA